MSVISDFYAKQKAFNDQMDQSIAALSNDIASLNAQILQFQNSPGAVSAADQASLDALQAHGQAMAVNLAAIDALAKPVMPLVA